MSGVPQSFSVAPHHQEIPGTTLAEIDRFIRIFERVTARPAWQDTVTTSAPEHARRNRSEVCFFSAWDFHLPPERPTGWQLIEFNDNGSGFLFAALINRLYYEVSGMDRVGCVEPPIPFASLAERVVGMVEREATEFYGEVPKGLFLVLDDLESLDRGRFRDELTLLRGLLRQKDWQCEIASPADIRWNGSRLVLGSREVSFIVNRSTDFLWQADVFSPLRAAYEAGSVYVAPNPFSYATRSDKGLLRFLSQPDWDEELGIRSGERAVLSDHVPETRLVREENLESLARRKQDFVFKPTHGFAGRGVLASSQVGRSRLRRLIKKGEGYVAQKKVEKPRLAGEGEEGSGLWTDLRVWAYRGERFLVSGRASRRSDVIDLSPPGGWLPTFVRR
jgi:hypothetical protein